MIKFTRGIYLTLVLFAFSLTPVDSALGKELIAYSHYTDGYWQVWVMDPEGFNKWQVTVSKQDKREPAWIEGGQRIAFRTNNGQLFIVDADGQNETEILKRYNRISNPHFSSDRNEMVFVRFDPRAVDMSDVWKSDLEGRNAILLTKDHKLKYQPIFSPQGDKIAFVKAGANKNYHHIWLMGADGSNLRQVTESTGLDTLPDFSPDERFIAFTSNRNGKDYEIYSVELRNGRVRQITDHPGLDTSSTFSPDGERLAFVSTRSGNQQIWVVNKDGGGLRQLTKGESESVDPAWIEN